MRRLTVHDLPLLSYTGIIEHEQVSLKGNTKRIAHERFGPPLPPKCPQESKPPTPGRSREPSHLSATAQKRGREAEQCAHKSERVNPNPIPPKSNPQVHPLSHAQLRPYTQAKIWRRRHMNPRDPGEFRPRRAGHRAERDAPHRIKRGPRRRRPDRGREAVPNAQICEVARPGRNETGRARRDQGRNGAHLEPRRDRPDAARGRGRSGRADKARGRYLRSGVVTHGHGWVSAPSRRGGGEARGRGGSA